MSSSGTATGTQSSGVYVRQAAFRAPYAYGLRQTAASAMSMSASDVVVDVENATGGQYGIRAINEGTGALSVTSTGLAQATGTTFDPLQRYGLSGIFAQNAASGSSLTIEANASIGQQYGIRANNLGTGALTIRTTGLSTGTQRDGISARNAATDLIIEAADTTGNLTGIGAANEGTGVLRITSSGLAQGQLFDGISALNTFGSGLSITAEDTLGTYSGIKAENYRGALDIISTGTATAREGTGIFAGSLFDTATSLTIQANNTSGSYGIVATNYGTGMLTITSVEDADGNRIGTARGTTGSAIRAQNTASGIGMTITVNDAIAGTADAEGSITGGIAGIYATNSGTAAVPEGSTATNGLTISVNNATGGQYGIRARNEGAGALSITSSGRIAATGTVADPNLANSLTGIYAFGGAAGTGIVMDVNEVSGGAFGIRAVDEGSGGITISASGLVEVTQPFNPARFLAGIGIEARNSGGGDITITAMDVDAARNGIYAVNTSGGISITATGSISGDNRSGIYAFGSETAVGSITIDSNDSQGRTSGVSAVHRGVGAIIINAGGTSYGSLTSGIFASNRIGGTDIMINAADAAGGENGIDVAQRGTGATVINSAGTASGTVGRGIGAYNLASATSLTINSVNADGGLYGIFAQNGGTGALTITSTGLAEATGTAIDPAFPNRQSGIFALNAASATDLSITANDTSGAASGIRAINNGTGMLSITSVEDADGNRIGTARSSSGTAIFAETAASGIGMTIAVNAAIAGVGQPDGSFSGGFGGINATNRGTASVPEGSAATNGLTISANTAIGGQFGVRAINEGAGALSITTTGAVMSETGRGIYAYNTGAGSDLAILTEAVTAAIGIEAYNTGSGRLTISTNGPVTGTRGRGIEAIDAGTGLTINAADVTGYGAAVDASNRGTGAMAITVTGSATATATAYGDGIRAVGSENTTSLTINANDTSGFYSGIQAFHSGTGMLAINAVLDADGNRIGTARGTAGSGIYARNNASGFGIGITIAVNDAIAGTQNPDGSFTGGLAGIDAVNAGTAAVPEGSGATNGLTISANNTTGGQYGIRAINDGTGALSVTSSGLAQATGTVSDPMRPNSLTGIFARNAASGTDLTVAANNTAGERHGIRARNEGTDALSITATGQVTGTTSDGLQAINRGSDLTITSGGVSGGFGGIFANNYGTGALTISSTGLVQGQTAEGIFARNSIAGGDLSVTAQDTTGALSGIAAINGGTGTLSVISTGTATGGGPDGIIAINSAAGTALSVVANNTNGGYHGIFARNLGKGALTVTSNGTASGREYRGIYAANFEAGTDLTVTANETRGVTAGIAASNYGTGALTLSSTSAIATGATGVGIQAIAGEDTTGLAVTTVETRGATGIFAANDGTGALEITTTGTTTGTTARGIDATNRGTSLTITANGPVTGGIDGIRARNYGTGGLTIIANGNVTGETGAAINAFNSANDVTASTLIEQAADESFIGATDGIIADNAGGSLTVNARGTLTGTTGSGVNATNQATATGMTLLVNNASGRPAGLRPIIWAAGQRASRSPAPRRAARAPASTPPVRPAT